MNNYFTLCSLNSKDPIDIYNCCIKQCDNNSICETNCSRVFSSDFIPKKQCALKEGCWENGWVEECIQKNQHSIVRCCEEECKLNPFIDGKLVDCKKYCSTYRLTH